MISSTEICNLALNRYGGGKITSLDDGSDTARVLQLNYENSINAVLRAFPWNFARKIELLGLTDDTTPGYDYVYQYPAECVKVLRIYDENSARLNEKAEFKIISSGTEKFIACDIANAYIEYTSNDIDVTLYDATFVRALSYFLAAEICNSKTGNAQKATEMMQKYQLAISEAQYNGALENNVKHEWPTNYKKCRR